MLQSIPLEQEVVAFLQKIKSICYNSVFTDSKKGSAEVLLLEPKLEKHTCREERATAPLRQMRG